MTATHPWQTVLDCARSNGRIEAFGDPEKEISAIAQELTKTPLSTLGIVTVSGPDAVDFLHAQLSADCRGLASGDSVLSAWCSPKGRVLFLLRVVRNSEGFILLLPAAQVDALLKRLRLYVLRAAVVLADCTTSHGIIVLNNAAQVPHELPAGLDSGRDGTQCWLMGDFETLAAYWPELDAVAVGEAAASRADIRRAIPLLDSALSDTFLPQELNLDQGRGVSFEKGCYPGQEIIARVKFRGAVKRRLARFIVHGSAAVVPGTRLLDAGEQVCGTVISGEAGPDDSAEILAVADLAALPTRLAGQPDRRLESVPFIGTDYPAG